MTSNFESQVIPGFSQDRPSRGAKSCHRPRHFMTPWTRIPLLVAALAVVPPATAAQPRDGQAFDDWSVRCEVPKGRLEEHCFIFQNLTITGTGERLMHAAAGYLTTDGKPAVTVTLPLGISLPPGIRLAVDGRELARLAFERCDQTGCFGAVALEDPLSTALTSGKEAQVKFMDGNRKEIVVPMSLRGFRGGFDALK